MYSENENSNIQGKYSLFVLLGFFVVEWLMDVFLEYIVQE